MSSVPQVAKTQRNFGRKMEAYVASGYIVISRKNVRRSRQPDSIRPDLVGMDGELDHIEPEDLVRYLAQGFTPGELSGMQQIREPQVFGVSDDL